MNIRYKKTIYAISIFLILFILYHSPTIRGWLSQETSLNQELFQQIDILEITYNPNNLKNVSKEDLGNFFPYKQGDKEYKKILQYLLDTKIKQIYIQDKKSKIEFIDYFFITAYNKEKNCEIEIVIQQYGSEFIVRIYPDSHSTTSEKYMYQIIDENMRYHR